MVFGVRCVELLVSAYRVLVQLQQILDFYFKTFRLDDNFNHL